MTGKRSNRLNSALVSVGMVALVAGCGGGGAVSNSNGSVTYIPPGGAKMATATLTLLVPGRRPASGNRAPRYISGGTARVDVSAVAAGAASPWPVATSTSIPSPGPAPSGGGSPTPIPVTMTVPVPAGSAQLAVNTYDSGGNLLSGVTSTPLPIAVNSANTINLTLHAAASCVLLNGKSPGAGFTMTPLENQASAQTATFTVTPCDADGFAIPAGETLGNAIVFATPAPVQVTVNSGQRHTLKAGTPTPMPTPMPTSAPGSLTFAPASITQGGPTTVTVTYPAHAHDAAVYQAVPSPFPSAGAQPSSITADPLYYVLIADSPYGSTPSLDVVVHDAQNVMTPFTLPFINSGFQGLYATGITSGSPMFGCAQAGQAVIPTSGYLNTITIPNPTAVNPTPQPVVAWVSYSGGNPSAETMDNSCNAYVGDTGGYLFSGPTGSAASQIGGPYSIGGGYNGSIYALGFANSAAYVGLGGNGGYLSNIVTAAGADTQVGETTGSMVPIGTNRLAVAYQPGSTGDWHIATWSPPATTFASDTILAGTSFYGVLSNGLAVDPAGNVWAIDHNNNLWRVVPSTGAATSWTLAGYQASAIAIAPDGMIFITDSYNNTLDMYSSANITAGDATSYGSTANRLQSIAIQPNAAGLTVVP